jgi:hypothetical protein
MSRSPLNSNFLGRSHSPQLGNVSDAFRVFSPNVFMFFRALCLFSSANKEGKSVFPDCGFQEDAISMIL